MSETLFESSYRYLVHFFVFDFAIQWIAFTFSAIFKTEKFFDLTGSISFFLIATASLTVGGLLHERQVMVTTLVCIWAVRLGTFLLMRVLKVGKDSRFDGVRNDPVQLFGFWNVQAIWVYIVSLPVMLVNLSSQNSPWVTPTDFIGISVWGVGFFVEALADFQKYTFKEDDANRGKWIESGLWRYSRHPNYLGEIILWWGLYIIALGSLEGWAVYLALFSPSFTAFMLIFVSGIPLLEEASDQKWGNNPAYIAYRNRTPVLVPGFKLGRTHNE